MNLNGDSRTRLRVVTRTDVDPDPSTVRLRVDSTWYDCTWQGAAVEEDGVWTRVALTDGFFAGYTHPAPAGAVVVTRGRHPLEGEVTPSGGDAVVVFAGDIYCE